jgi:hypothetical protein
MDFEQKKGGSQTLDFLCSYWFNIIFSVFPFAYGLF